MAAPVGHALTQAGPCGNSLHISHLAAVLAPPSFLEGVG